jgi:5-methylcytosine-specific restriction endonuclease McrA
LFVHLAADAIRSHDRSAPVTVENAGGHLLTAGQVADWCGRADTSSVTVKPVIDLNHPAATSGYRVPDTIAQRVRLRDRTCVFPYCHRPARACDLDHVVPYDENGPPGQTSTDNLACLCRLHHRMKTHADWSYYPLVPGTFLWHSPHGHTWLRDPDGTTDLTPATLEPPER